MKNKFLIFFLFCIFFTNYTFAEQFKFETSDIKIADEGKFIYAKDGKALSADRNIEIEAKNFKYSRDLDNLKAFKGTAFIKSENLKIKFEEIELDQKKSIIEAKGNVKIYEINKNFIIETNSINYNRILNILKSSTNSILKDNLGNKILTKKFEYNIFDKVLKIENAELNDFDNNKYQIDLAYLNTSTNRLFGKDIFIDLNNKSFNEGNEPRLKGKSITYENDFTEITKGVFTTCKRRDKCPPWQLSAEKIKHDKKNQTIHYKNAWLKVYDVPLIYFPKFFHPDPTVKRKSGFLIPSIKSSTNSNSFLDLPYYHVISENKDITFSPRLYADEKFLLQSEFRQENFKSSHMTDVSFFKEKNKESKNHFFYDYKKEFDYLSFDESNIDISIQKTSNDTYLRANKLKSPLINRVDFLESHIDLNLYSEDLSIESEFVVYEDLNKDSSDRYEFILPNLNITKSIENKTKLKGDFIFSSNNYIKNYQTNIFEKININELVFNSTPKISSKGFYNNYDFIFKNVNSDTRNSTKYKENENYFISGLLQLNSTLPLIKENNNFKKIIKPKFSLKLSPNNTKNLSNDSTRLDVNNIYDLNRISASDTLEGGASITYGNDFTIFDKNKSREIFGLKIANNLRFEENYDLPSNNQLGQKTSNFFGEISYNPNSFLNTKYKTSLKNNIQDITYENLTTELSINNFVTTFDYLNENDTSGKSSYMINTTKYSFDNQNNISFSTRENKETDLTEYYKFMYQYKNDCLAASIEYNKDYYDDRDIKPEENIFIKLTIIPFGETSTPDLKN